MTINLANVTFDCTDPLTVGRFWSAVLGRPLDDGATQYFASIGADAERPGAPRWLFIAVPEPKSAKNRMHVDLVATDRPAELTRLVDLGAVHVTDHEEWGLQWSVLRDPEGNEFCLADERVPASA
jgi:predicted enzyme related to lactoylglutathione lyase